MANSSDVAKLAGVSRATVSAVLNGRAEEQRIPAETAERVRAAAAELGYQVTYHARSLRTGLAGSIGFIAGDPERPRTGLLSALMAEAAAKGWYLSLLPPSDSGEESERDLAGAIAGLRSGRFDGLLVDCDHDAALARGFEGLDESLQRRLLLLDAPPSSRVASLRSDLGRALGEACKHLASRGHRGCCLLDDGDLGRRLCAGEDSTRLIGLARSAGLDLLPIAFAGDEDPVDCLDRMRAQGVDHRAIILPDAPSALSLIDGIRARELRVPEDMAICCLEDPLCALSDPPLDSIDPRYALLAQQAIDGFAALLAGKWASWSSPIVYGVFQARGSSIFLDGERS